MKIVTLPECSSALQLLVVVDNPVEEIGVLFVLALLTERTRE